MSPQNLFVATMSLCLVNGLVSPALPVMMALWPVWMPEMVRPNNEIVFYGASLLVATGTLLLSAIPAAVVERFGTSQATANGVWLGGAAVLSLLGLR